MIDSLLLETMCGLRKCFAAKITWDGRFNLEQNDGPHCHQSRTTLHSNKRITVINSLHILRYLPTYLRYLGTLRISKIPLNPTIPEREPQRQALTATSLSVAANLSLLLTPSSTKPQKVPVSQSVAFITTRYPQNLVSASPALVYCTRKPLPALASVRSSAYNLQR